MIRHIVLLKWIAGTTSEQHKKVLDELGRLPEIIPEIRTFAFHSDAGLGDGNADLIVTGEFDDADGYRTYAAHPDHVAVVDQHIKPILANRTAIQHQF